MWLTLPVELEGVPAQPVAAAGATLGLGELASLADAPGAFSGGGQATELSVLHDGPGHPVDLGIATDRLVGNVDQDHLEVLVRGILAHPVAVEDAETLQFTANTLLPEKMQKNNLVKN